MSNTTIRVVTEPREFESLIGVWDSLLQKCRDDNSMFLTHEWLSTWWRYFGEGRKLNILLIEEEGHIVGIIPLIRTEYRMGFIKFDALESIGRTSCNYVGLISPENRDEAITALLDYLEKELASNKVIMRLSWIPEDSQFLSVLRGNSAPFLKNLVIQEKVATLAPYIALPATWDEYFRSISRKRRQILRRALQSLEEAHTVEFQLCTADLLKGGLGKFFDLHQRRWQSVNVNSEFSNPRAREFYREVANQFLKKNWLHFSFLTIDNEIVSAIFSCIYNRKLYAITAARDPVYLKYSLGHLHHMFLIKDAISRQLQEFDFLRGDEPYKFYWTRTARRYIQVILIKRSFCPGLRLKLIRAFLRLCEIRQYSLRQIYFLYLIKRRERKEIRRMGLGKSG